MRSVFRARNSQPKPGNPAQAGHALIRLAELVVDEAAEDEDLAVVDEHRRRDSARVRHEVGRSLDGRAQARGLLLDLELHAAALVDLRRDLEARADFFALDRLERVHGALVRAGVRELTGDERNLLADADLGFLVVERHDLRRRDDVGLAVAAQRVQERRPARRCRVILPTPIVMPSAIAARFGVSPAAAPANPRMPPPPALVKFVRPSKSSSAEQPRDAELRGLFLAELDDDRVDLHLQARNVDLVDDREHVLRECAPAR